MKKFFKILSISFLSLLLLVIILVKPSGRDDYRNAGFYLETMKYIQTLQQPAISGKSVLQAGWAKSNITPGSAGVLAGYGLGRDYTYIIDSVFVKALVLSTNSSKGVILNYEMLMVHPFLKDKIEAALRHENLAFDFIYFTSSHTHHGAGGFAPGLSGYLVGGYDADVVALIVKNTIKAVQEADSNLLPAKMSYNKVATRGMVVNRVSLEDYTDANIHFIRFENSKHQVAYFSTYTAHPTILSSNIKGLSGDYPSAFVQKLENTKKIDFAIFAAGGVASHGPLSLSNLFSVNKYGGKLASYVLNNRSWKLNQSQINMQYTSIPIEMPDPEFRLADWLVLRPYLFNFFFEPQTANITVLQLGKVVLIGYPADFSGELVPMLDISDKSSPYFPVVTSFNGNYIGYLSHPKHYLKNHHEIQDMNWYGHDAGYYFTDITNQMLKKVLIE